MFFFFLKICGWLGVARDWFHGKQRCFSFLSSTFELDTSTGGDSISFWFCPSRISLSLDVVVVGEEDELEDVKRCLSCLEGLFEVDEDPEGDLDKPGTTTGTKFSVLQIIRISFLMRYGF